MFRLLIVDDEPDIVESLYVLFTDIKDMELDVYRAYSGKDALDWLNRTKIDIVLTDIRMPGMNGLQLLDSIRASWPQCRVVFLTGYNEFDYVYKAIKYEGVSYILKTEGHEAIIHEIEKMIAEIEKSLKMEQLLLEVKEKMAMTFPLIQRDFLRELIMEGDNGLENRMRQFEELDILLDADKPVLLLMGKMEKVDNKMMSFDRSKLIHAVKAIVEKYFFHVVRCVCVEIDKFSFVWFIQPLSFEEDCGKFESQASWKRISLFVRDTLETVQEIIWQSLNVMITFVVNNRQCTWEELPEEFESLKKMIFYRIGTHMDMRLIEKISTDEEEDALVASYADARQMRFVLKKIHTLEGFLENGQRDNFLTLLAEMTFYLKDIRSKNNNFALEMYYSISLMFLSHINKWNLAEKLAFRLGLNKLMRADEHASWSDAVKYLLMLSDNIFDIRHNEEEKRALNVINDIKKYISDNIDEDLSLVRLGELFHFNPSYLSRLFKQVTGKNLSYYINEVRLEKAKEMLRTNRYKIHEIATKLGYISAPYFTRIFKKAMNMSPQEYRDYFCDLKKS